MAKTMTEHEFSDCLHKNKIVIFSGAKKLVDRELKAAQDDLKAASQSLSDGREKWATVQAYYAMFHTAREGLPRKKSLLPDCGDEGVVCCRPGIGRVAGRNFSDGESFERKR